MSEKESVKVAIEVSKLQLLADIAMEHMPKSTGAMWDSNLRASLLPYPQEPKTTNPEAPVIADKA